MIMIVIYFKDRIMKEFLVIFSRFVYLVNICVFGMCLLYVGSYGEKLIYLFKW